MNKSSNQHQQHASKCQRRDDVKKKEQNLTQEKFKDHRKTISDQNSKWRAESKQSKQTNCCFESPWNMMCVKRHWTTPGQNNDGDGCWLVVFCCSIFHTSWRISVAFRGLSERVSKIFSPFLCYSFPVCKRTHQVVQKAPRRKCIRLKNVKQHFVVGHELAVSGLLSQQPGAWKDSWLGHIHLNVFFSNNKLCSCGKCSFVVQCVFVPTAHLSFSARQFWCCLQLLHWTKEAFVICHIEWQNASISIVRKKKKLWVPMLLFKKTNHFLNLCSADWSGDVTDDAHQQQIHIRDSDCANAGNELFFQTTTTKKEERQQVSSWVSKGAEDWTNAMCMRAFVFCVMLSSKQSGTFNSLCCTSNKSKMAKGGWAMFTGVFQFIVVHVAWIQCGKGWAGGWNLQLSLKRQLCQPLPNLCRCCTEPLNIRQACFAGFTLCTTCWMLWEPSTQLTTANASNAIAFGTAIIPTQQQCQCVAKIVLTCFWI